MSEKKRGSSPTLDPDVCWAMYQKLGSLAKVTAQLEELGIVSDRTARAFTRQSVHMALLRHPKYRRERQLRRKRRDTALAKQRAWLDEQTT